MEPNPEENPGIEIEHAGLAKVVQELAKEFPSLERLAFLSIAYMEQMNKALQIETGIAEGSFKEQEEKTGMVRAVLVKELNSVRENQSFDEQELIRFNNTVRGIYDKILGGEN